MIIGILNNIKLEKTLYPEAIQIGLNFLLSNDLNSLKIGTYQINDEKIFAKVSEYVTEPKSCRRPEQHKKYIDIQYLVSGEELIASCTDRDVEEIDEDKLLTNDIIYYKDARKEIETILKAGMFAIYFPWDIHRPNCSVGKFENVKKVVVKVAIDEVI